MKTEKNCINVSTSNQLIDVITQPQHHFEGLIKPENLQKLNKFRSVIRYDEIKWHVCLEIDFVQPKKPQTRTLLQTYHDVQEIPYDSYKSQDYEIHVWYQMSNDHIERQSILIYHLNFTRLNQEAWNEAYVKSPKSYKDIAHRLMADPTQFLTQRLMKHLDKVSLRGHHIAQLACNNGREVLAILKHYGADKATGFDISKAMVADANQTAQLLNLDAQFISTNLYDIDTSYDHTFDDIFMMIGAITWFDDLAKLFKIVSSLLKPKGHFYLLDGHPITGMFAFEGEEGFDSNNPEKLVYSYFKKDPFIETDGMYYMTKKTYESHPFISFSHTFQDIIQGLIDANLRLMVFEEGNENMLENFPDLDGKHVPLIFYIDAIKSDE